MFGFFESSRSKGAPVELYYFRYGTKPNAYSAQTNAARPITLSGVTYRPTAITRGEIVVTGTLDRTQLEIETTKNNPIGELFRVYPPSAPVSLKIYQGHVGDPDEDFKIIWGGRITNCSWQRSKLIMTGEVASTSALSVGLRRHWQVMCPHMLYGPRCKVAITPFLRETTILGVSSNTLELSSGWNGSIDHTKYLGGVVRWPSDIIETDMQPILKVVDATHIRVAHRPPALEVGTVIEVAPGCNHTLLDDCTQIYNNANNYGGCPWVPYKNPVNNPSSFI